MFLTPPALLAGLGARILLDKFTRNSESTFADFIFVGIWQGIALHYSTSFPGTSLVVGSAIAAKFLIEFHLLRDTNRCIITVCGVTLGFLASEFLSQFLHSPPSIDPDRRSKRPQGLNAPPPREKRVVQFRQNDDVLNGHAKNHHPPPDSEHMHTISDITSIESSSEMLTKNIPMTPSERLEREIKNLRMRASLADSERRRFKEERKWAISQGNEARALQMKWQVKRYAALMENFHREADAKLIEASGGRPPHFVSEDSKGISRPTRHRKDHSEGQMTGITVPIADGNHYRKVSKPAPRESTIR